MNVTAQVSEVSDGWLVLMPLTIEADTKEDAIRHMEKLLAKAGYPSHELEVSENCDMTYMRYGWFTSVTKQ